jgi:hypothetical protein
MLRLVPTPESESALQPYAEAVSRLASVRHALRLVDGFGGGPAPDVEDEAIAAAWDSADEAKRRSFDRHSARLVGTAAAGVEALLGQRQQGRVPNEEASRALVEQIRRELAEVAKHILPASEARRED